MNHPSKCPACGQKGSLSVVGGIFKLSGTKLRDDGTYDLLWPKCRLSNEVVECDCCKSRFLLEDVLSGDRAAPLGNSLELNTSGASMIATIRPIGAFITLALNGIAIKKLIGRESLKRFVALVFDRL